MDCGAQRLWRLPRAGAWLLLAVLLVSCGERRAEQPATPPATGVVATEVPGAVESKATRAIMYFVESPT